MLISHKIYFFFVSGELNPDINLDLQAQHDIEKLKSKTNRFTPSESAYSPNFGVFKRVSSEGKTVSKPRVNCLKYKSSYIYENLRQESKYFLSLFAINTKTGGSVAYEGASFFTRKRELEVFTLQDGKMVASYLNPARAAFKLYQFRVKHFHRNVLLNIQPCSGTLRVQIFKDDQLIKRSLFEELKSFVFESVTPGVLKIKVSNDDNDAKIYRIWASVKTSKNPYPKMPVDTSIKVLEHSRTCHSVTLAWLLTK